jgi:CubicO group peptidase (beta-lactamase class C family)
MSKLSTAGAEYIRQIIDRSTQDPHKDIPGLSVSITNSNGDDLFTYAHGVTSADSTKPLTEDSVFWVASCTKIVATIAVLQVVEQGKLCLDDAEQLETILPELKNLPIASLDENGDLKLTKKKNKITLRMLLSHTSGLGYSFFSPIIRKWAELFGIDEFDCRTESEIQFPLLFEPGTDWQYGIGIDWAGTALQRVTGENLGDYIQEHILKPLDVQESSFTPDESLRAKLVEISQRDPKTSELSTREHYYKKVISASYGDLFYHSGGAGLFSKPHEYVKILAMILNNGTSPTTGARILSSDTISSMFQNQIPQWPDFGRQGIPAADPILTNAIPDIYPQGDNVPQGWGLSWFLTPKPGATGRGANTGFWCGIANTFYWCDQENGIAGMVAGQILPFADPKVMGAWVEIESAVYSNLE